MQLPKSMTLTGRDVEVLALSGQVRSIMVALPICDAMQHMRCFPNPHEMNRDGLWGASRVDFVAPKKGRVFE